MSDMQHIEINRYHSEIVDDVKQLIEKYRRAMDWDIPENDNKKSDKIIFAAIESALASVKKDILGS
ncbi:hypothetical protein [sulfur-oxidizing endosymbiont of Gigantopelta aegis]|uniref:hypothetical protein n=1 Tax=sulfur-oxidizing endosymbiont of Gigantopelta aegis TaxID=2794934 RepID=UPI0018DC1A30|nr:hypothetical protein [sulfur-oxidizing endosymbiont of Gigantopelta aegis]